MTRYATNTDVPYPTERRRRRCFTCPFGPNLKLPRDVMLAVAERIAGGEKWVCHSTCDGIHITERSLLCAVAPHMEATA